MPKSKLVVKMTEVSQPKFPVIDAHNHLAAPFGGGWDQRPVSELLDTLDEAGVTAYVDLDGGWGEDILHRHLDTIKAAAPDRFYMFGGVDWSQWVAQGDQFRRMGGGALSPAGRARRGRAENLETVRAARPRSARDAGRRRRRAA